MTTPPDSTNSQVAGRRFGRLNIPDEQIDRILHECVAAINGQVPPPDGLLLTPTKFARVTAKQATAILEGLARKPRKPTSAEAARRLRCSAQEAAAILGLSSRTTQHLAARGEIAGAAKLGRRWTFDLEKLRRLVKQRERETWQDAKPQPDATGAPALFGVGRRYAVGTSAGRFTQVTRRLRGRHTRPRGNG